MPGNASRSLPTLRAILELDQRAHRVVVRRRARRVHSMPAPTACRETYPTSATRVRLRCFARISRMRRGENPIPRRPAARSGATPRAAAASRIHASAGCSPLAWPATDKRRTANKPRPRSDRGRALRRRDHFAPAPRRALSPRATTSVMPSALPQVLLINASSCRVDSVMPLSLLMSPSNRSRSHAESGHDGHRPRLRATATGRQLDCQSVKSLHQSRQP